MSLLIKICGLSTPETIDAARAAGADMIGLVFHPKSPRYVAPAQAASLAATARTPGGRAPAVAALVVDADDALLEILREAVAPDIWQLHGAESPGRVRAIKTAFGIPTMQAIGVATAADVAGVANRASIADRILIDAKPPRDAAYPGGHGRPFDWPILASLPPDLGFMLSGGLSPANVGEAIRTVRGMGLALAGVDVSSGVESAPGIKDPALIRAFVAAARAA